MQTSSPNRIPEAGLSALCQALAPREVRVSYAAHRALPFRVEFVSEHGLLTFHGTSADAAATAALRDVGIRRSNRVAEAIQPEGEGPYVEALREWIEQVTPAQAARARPVLRLVR